MLRSDYYASYQRVTAAMKLREIVQDTVHHMFSGQTALCLLVREGVAAVSWHMVP
jgi:hypothetical protein